MAGSFSNSVTIWSYASVKEIQLAKLMLIEWFVESDRKQHFAKDRRDRRILWHEYRCYGRKACSVIRRNTARIRHLTEILVGHID